MIHELKTDPKYFAAVRSGEKRFELRRNDRDFHVGDHLALNEYDWATKTYTGRSELVQVVRCAQCKWWTPKDGTWKSFGDCSEMAERYTEDCESDMDCQTGYNDFCSCGERKE